VTLAGLLSATRNAGTSINDMKFLCAGAGSAGLGVCSQIVDGMIEAGELRCRGGSGVLCAVCCVVCGVWWYLLCVLSVMLCCICGLKLTRLS
jgi:hypothetical protein